MTVTTVRYLSEIPRDPLTPGYVVVHNHVKPQRVLGLNGFRAWVAATEGAVSEMVDPAIAELAPGPYEVERCACPWAPGLPEHYRVVRDG